MSHFNRHGQRIGYREEPKRPKSAQCKDKKRHPDRFAANYQIAGMRKNGIFTDLVPYLCPHCETWHVGHRMPSPEKP